VSPRNEKPQLIADLIEISFLTEIPWIIDKKDETD
jgi:hypothetical protein